MSGIIEIKERLDFALRCVDGGEIEYLRARVDALEDSLKALLEFLKRFDSRKDDKDENLT